MAKLYATTTGQLIRFLQTRDELEAYPDPPPGTVYTFDFDPATNTQLVNALNGAWQTVTAVGGTLRISGTPYTIQNPGIFYGRESSRDGVDRIAFFHNGSFVAVRRALNVQDGSGSIINMTDGLGDWVNLEIGAQSGPGGGPHAATHAVGGTDPVSPASIGASATTHNHDTAYSAITHNHTGVYAPVASGVTGGDAHDHSGGDGAQIAHSALSGAGTNTHAQIDAFMLTATAPTYARVAGSNATTTGQVLVAIPGLSADLLANSVYEFEAVLSVQSSSTAGTKYGVNFSAAGAAVEGQLIGSASATATKSERVSAFNTASGVYVGAAITGQVLIKGIITVGANAGTLTIQHLKVTSGTSTVFINSFLKVSKIA